MSETIRKALRPGLPKHAIDALHSQAGTQPVSETPRQQAARAIRSARRGETWDIPPELNGLVHDAIRLRESAPLVEEIEKSSKASSQ